MHARVVQFPDVHRVEPELGLGFGAEGDDKIIGCLVARAVAPQANVVEVLKIEILLGLLQRLHQLVIAQTGRVSRQVEQLGAERVAARRQVGEVGLSRRDVISTSGADENMPIRLTRKK